MSRGEAEGGGSVAGERFLPDAQRERLIEAEHLARYFWAARAVPGREVLDAGCGLGYGTAILARAGATSARGLDLDAEAVSQARELFGDVAEFEVGDLMALPHGPESFDLIVSFEALEHLADPERMLDECRRVLRSDGLLVLSSPNRGVYPPGNPYHLNEYTSAELEQTLRERYRHVRLLRQTVHTASVITDDSGLVASDPEVEVAASVRKLEPNAPGDELFALAIASDAELPQLGNMAMLSGMLSLRDWVDEIAAWSDRARWAEAELSFAQGEAGQAKRELELIEIELEKSRGG